MKPRELGAAEGEALLAIDRTVRPHKPVLPRHLWRDTQEFEVSARICVGRTGLVETAEATHFPHPEFGQAAVRAIIGWRYNPLRMNGVRTPFCYEHVLLLRR